MKRFLYLVLHNSSKNIYDIQLMVFYLFKSNIVFLTLCFLFKCFNWQWVYDTNTHFLCAFLWRTSRRGRSWMAMLKKTNNFLPTKYCTRHNFLPTKYFHSVVCCYILRTCNDAKNKKVINKVEGTRVACRREKGLSRITHIYKLSEKLMKHHCETHAWRVFAFKLYVRLHSRDENILRNIPLKKKKK
jgi:hypothetical protein